MIELVNPLAEQYAAGFSAEEDALLHEVAMKTQREHPLAHMLSGHVQGRFLSMLSQLIQPRRILEIGTFTGYSALWLSKGLTQDGELHTIELREEDASTARAYFNQSVQKDKIKLHVGDARTIIPAFDETWDLVFIDADKTGYIDYYELILPSVRQNGLVIADNVLFHGDVLEPVISGKNAKAIHAFNAHVKSDVRIEQVLVTLRDGLMLMRKL